MSMTLGWSNPAADPTTTILLRHGDTALSPEHRFSGRRDLPLSARGTRQAKAAACRLAAGAPIDAVVSSPLRRAVGTADIVAAELGVAPVIDDDLGETDFGDWEGHTADEVRRQWPAEHAAWLASLDAAPPGGEAFAEVARRTRRARDTIIAAHPGETVIAVSHVTPIKVLLMLALDAPLLSMFRLHLDTASISRTDYFPNGASSVGLVNDTAHLDAG
jgi:probable phosphoglycerate mutase